QLLTSNRSPSMFTSWFTKVSRRHRQHRAKAAAPPRHRTKRRVPSVERLEDRLVPNVDFKILAVGLDSSLTTAEGDLSTIDSTKVLPVVGLPLAKIPHAGANLIKSFKPTLVNKILGSNACNIQQDLLDVLGPAGLKLISGPNDVVVTPATIANDV